MPLSWCWCRIDTVAFVTKLAGFEYTNHIAPSLTNHGIPLFKGKNIQGNNIIYEFESFIPRNVSDNLPRSQINKKCILLPYVGTLGNIGVHTKKGIFHLGSNVGKIELTCNEFHALLLEEYIVFYLRSSYGFKGLVREKKATAQDSISIQAIRNICIPIPPFAEQKRIVTQIGTLFDCVDELEQSVDSLGTVVSLTKQKILDLAIRGKLVPQDPNDEPASELLKKIKAEKETLIKSGKLKRDKHESFIFRGDDNCYHENVDGKSVDITDMIPFNLPDSWEWVRLASLGSVIGGGTPSTSVPDYWDGAIPWLSPCDLSDYKGKYISRGKRNISQKGLDHSSAVLMPSGSILYSSRAPIGYVVIASNQISTNQGFKSLVPIVDGMDEFIYYTLKALTPDIRKRATGTTFKEISGSEFGKTMLPLPPLAEQKRIVSQIEKMFSILETMHG